MNEEPDLPPLVTRVEPIVPPRPGPGFLKAAALTFGYWVFLIGGMLAVVLTVAVFLALFGEQGAAESKPNDGTNDIARMPPEIRTALAWSFPAGYLFGLLYSVAVIRKVVGPGWVRSLGLKRLPPYHLLLGLLALPGFIILSDALARLVQPIDPVISRSLGIRDLGDMGLALQALFADFHWSFAVLAIGTGPGLVEELWCRGFLGRGFIGRYGWLVGIGLSSAFFGLLHLWPPSYVLVTAAMGACLHVTYIASRSLWVPILIHFANNSFAALAVMNVIPAKEIDAAIAANEVVITALAACLLITCGAAMWQARWTWPSTGSGEMLPPIEWTSELENETPTLLFFGPAIVSCGVLVWLLKG